LVGTSTSQPVPPAFSLANISSFEPNTVTLIFTPVSAVNFSKFDTS
jgi:hypothetical protein